MYVCVFLCIYVCTLVYVSLCVCVYVGMRMLGRKFMCYY